MSATFDKDGFQDELRELVEEGKKKTQSVMDKQKFASTKAVEILGNNGRMISGSKSAYTWDNPKNIAIFNANILTESGKIWYGDLDITKDEKVLVSLAKILGVTLFVLYESDARFENEENPKIENALFVVNPAGIELGTKTMFDGRPYSVAFERAAKGKLKGALVYTKEFTRDTTNPYEARTKKKTKKKSKGV